MLSRVELVSWSEHHGATREAGVLLTAVGAGGWWGVMIFGGVLIVWFPVYVRNMSVFWQPSLISVGSAGRVVFDDFFMFECLRKHFHAES